MILCYAIRDTAIGAIGMVQLVRVSQGKDSNNCRRYSVSTSSFKEDGDYNNFNNFAVKNAQEGGHCNDAGNDQAFFQRLVICFLYIEGCAP